MTLQPNLAKYESVTREVREDADTMLNTGILETMDDMNNKRSSYSKRDEEALISSVLLPCSQKGSVDPSVEFPFDEQITGEEQQEKIISRVERDRETAVNDTNETLRNKHREEKRDCDISEMHRVESNLIVVGLASVEEKETSPCGFSKRKSCNDSDSIDCPSGETGQILVVLGLPVCVDGSYKSPVKTKETPLNGLSKKLFGTPPNPDVYVSDAMKVGPSGSTGLHSVELPEKIINSVVLGLPVNGFNSKEKTPVVPIVKKYPLRSSKDCKNPEICSYPRPSTISENAKKKKRKKNKKTTGKIDDEFLRIRRQLRYLLSRIQYEQSLLDAYSSEGWRGQSVEKLRPEKELERAKAEINRSKLKIRDLFQRLDSLSCEGKFPESLFDSEGLIDSEDIFCAKCESKDSAIDNDIILCDGACDRGFHQCCLEPPLRTEEIPPDEEGWLCPACDCKVDLLELLNDSYGTKLSVEDSWEKVFPDVAAAVMVGNEHDHMMGLPSDDSDDTDFDPDRTIDDNDEVEGSKSRSDNSYSSNSSDSSDFSSASEDLRGVCANEPYLGLPSDDSEDDDYDPDAANVDDHHDKHQSSSSEFSSASEDLGVGVGFDETLGDRVVPSPLLEKDEDLGEISPVCGRRHVERLDYKKLYDETYGNTCSDSSDDEEWTDIDTSTKKTKADVNRSVSAGPTRRSGRTKPSAQASNGSPAPLKKSSRSVGSSSKKRSRGKIGEFATQKLYETFENDKYPDRDTKEKLAKEVGLTTKQVSKWFENARVGAGTSKNRGRMKRNAEAINGSSSSVKRSQNIGISAGNKRPHNKIGEFATQKLYESFKNNQYPDRDTKEKLAKETGLTTKQVTKWFENARWSFNHHRSKMEATMSAATSQCIITSPNVEPSKVGTSKGNERTFTPRRRSCRLNRTDQSGTHKDACVEGIINKKNIESLEVRVVKRKRKRSRG